ncbi:MAG: hypothetical protein FWD73_08220, partial [Polyangiaceae bacterium]|nr:hypothetical protein [Polyangiaceae bacterium]
DIAKGIVSSVPIVAAAKQLSKAHEAAGDKAKGLADGAGDRSSKVSDESRTHQQLLTAGNIVAPALISTIKGISEVRARAAEQGNTAWGWFDAVNRQWNPFVGVVEHGWNAADAIADKDAHKAGAEVTHTVVAVANAVAVVEGARGLAKGVGVAKGASLAEGAEGAAERAAARHGNEVLSQVRAKELLAKVQQVEPQVTKELSQLAKENGGKMEGLDYRLKSHESLSRKLADEPGKPVNDALRYTQIYESKNLGAGAKNVMASMENNGYKKVAVNNTFQDGVPYKGINTVWETPSGTRFEVQFHTPESFDIKQNVNHSLYEQGRMLPAGDPGREAISDRMIQNSNRVPVPKNIQNDIPNFRR